jgi:hypothetical protein
MKSFEAVAEAARIRGRGDIRVGREPVVGPEPGQERSRCWRSGAA